MKTSRSTPKPTHVHETRPRVPEDIRQGFELLGLTEQQHRNYSGAQKFSRNFIRCSKTKFTQVTYAASSH